MRKLLLSLCLLPALALANPPGHGDMPFAPDSMSGRMPRGHGRAAFKEMLDNLNLTDKQQDEVKALFKAHQGEVETKIKETHNIETDIHRLSFSGDYSDDKVQPLLDKAAALHKEIRLQKAKLDNAIFKMLTGDQQKQLQSQFGK